MVRGLCFPEKASASDAAKFERTCSYQPRKWVLILWTASPQTFITALKNGAQPE